MVALTVGLLAQLAIVTHAPLDTAQGVDVHAGIAPDTIFVGQQTTYEVGVFIDDQLRLRLRHNPEFVPPDPQGLLAYDLPSGSRMPSVRRVGRRVYEVHVFARAFFPLAAGTYRIPSAQLVYSLPLSMSFFSREETHTLVAESLSVVARPVPADGRPADYAGAVGELTVFAHLDSTAARVGDPMLLTISVAGRGDVKLFPRPAVAVPWATSVAGQERVRIDTANEEVHGTKEFDYLLTPRDSGALLLPSVRYPYFNPYTERYEIAAVPPTPVHVGPGGLALGDTARTETPPPLSIRTMYRGPVSPPLYDRPEFFALALGAPVPGLLVLAARRPKRRTRRTRTAAGALMAAGRQQPPPNATTTRRLYVKALSERFDLPPTVLTDRGELTHSLRREGVTGAVAAAAEAMLVRLDGAAFGRAPVTEDLARQAAAIYHDVVTEARVQRRTRRTPAAGSGVATRRMAIGLASALLIGSAQTRVRMNTASAQRHAFAAGVTAYAARDFRTAAADFAQVAQWAPRAPDAWANAGTAAWALGDSADAVVGWQRAGRLEPLAHDIRDRLALVRAPQEGPLARLPIVPPPWAANFALGCWILACVTGTWRLWRSRTAGSFASVVPATLAMIAGFGAIRSQEVAAARHLFVVNRGAVLHTSPALDADARSRLDGGDIAFGESTQGVWTHVRLDGDREGWVEADKLIPLAANTSR